MRETKLRHLLPALLFLADRRTLHKNICCCCKEGQDIGVTVPTYTLLFFYQCRDSAQAEGNRGPIRKHRVRESIGTMAAPERSLYRHAGFLRVRGGTGNGTDMFWGTSNYILARKMLQWWRRQW